MNVVVVGNMLKLLEGFNYLYAIWREPNKDSIANFLVKKNINEDFRMFFFQNLEIRQQNFKLNLVLDSKGL